MPSDEWLCDANYPRLPRGFPLRGRCQWPWSNLNGELVAKEQASVINVYDHGLLYGDGVFEGIRFYNGKSFVHHDHIERLYESA
jgi:hypothetical protein